MGSQAEPLPVTGYVLNLDQHPWLNESGGSVGVGQRQLDGGDALVTAFGQFVPASLGVDLGLCQPVFQNIRRWFIPCRSAAFNVDCYAHMGT